MRFYFAPVKYVGISVPGAFCRTERCRCAPADGGSVAATDRGGRERQAPGERATLGGRKQGTTARVFGAYSVVMRLEQPQQGYSPNTLPKHTTQ